MRRNTKQRKLVLELVQTNHMHPTAEEVYQMARKCNKTISRATVYRDLGVLVEMGLLRRYRLGDAPDHFDFVSQEHYHFLCQKCGKMIDIPFSHNQKLNMPLPEMPGYQVEGHTLLFHGLCPECGHQNT